MSTLEIELEHLRSSEQKKLLDASEKWEEYVPLEYEILEWEIREVAPDEGILVRQNPFSFPASVQRKYFWASAEDWDFPVSVDPEDEVPEHCSLQSQEIENPYTNEKKIIYSYRYNPPPPPPTNEEIGESITQEVYDGNPYAQIADLAKAQVTTLALLVPILGKEVVVSAYADLIVTVKKVSEARVKQWLSPYDLSFLE